MKFKCDKCNREVDGELFNIGKGTICKKCGGNMKSVLNFGSFSSGKIIFIGLIILIGLIVLFGTFYTVGPGQRAILLTFGSPDMNAKGPGLHFKAPLIQQAVIMNVQTQKYIETGASASSSDLQTVTTEVAINYHINPEDVATIYTNIGVDYQNVVITPAVLETLKSVTAKYTAEQLITQRQEVKDKIDAALTTRLQTYNILVESISITNFEFSSVFTNAIENKVTAQQNALAAQNTLEQKKFEAQQILVTAQAQAQANELLQQSATEGVIALQTLQVQQQAIAKWNGVLPQVTGGATPFVSLTGNFNTSR